MLYFFPLQVLYDPAGIPSPLPSSAAPSRLGCDSLMSLVPVVGQTNEQSQQE